MLSDSEIIGRIRQGDVKQFEILFRSSYVSLVKYAGTIVKDRDTAEEIVQDLFFRMWQDRDKIKIKSSLNGYLFRAVHNRCLHHIEHLRVVEKYEKEVVKSPERQGDNPSDLVLLRELQERIASVLESLPERCGDIFCMSRFEGLRYEEIAQKLQISVKTVEANMTRAIKEFRKALEE